jgi:hypothetical protein
MLTVCAVIVGVLAGTTQTASAFVACPAAGVGGRSAGIARWITLWGTERRVAKGVTLCRAEAGTAFITNGYLEIVDLADGAKVRLQSKMTTESYSSFYEPQVLFDKRTARGWYEWIRGLRRTNETATWLEPERSRLFSTTNATFFREGTPSTTTRLPFPYINYSIEETLGMSFARAHPTFPTEGWETEPERSEVDYERPKKTLLLSANFYEEGIFPEIQRVAIQPFRSRYEIEDMANWEEEIEEFFVADAAVSLPPEYDLGGERASNQRTYIGVYGRVVYVWVTESKYTNAQANATMQEIRPGMRAIQMDGGGSTQFYTNGYGERRSEDPIIDRPVPTVLAIYRSK